jgi:hypothetical protein
MSDKSKEIKVKKKWLHRNGLKLVIILLALCVLGAVIQMPGRQQGYTTNGRKSRERYGYDYYSGTRVCRLVFDKAKVTDMFKKVVLKSSNRN